jgi:TRAP transporter TAXI family solute receptor
LRGHGEIPELTKRFSRRWIIRAGLSVFTAALIRPVGGLAQEVRYFRIGTGESGGSLFILGGVIASAVSNPPGSRSCDDGGSCGVPGLIALAQSTAGSVENVTDIAAGQLDSGLCQADVAYWAYAGKDIFDHGGPVATLRALANLYEESVHVVVHRDGKIKTVNDLKGARVNLGPKNSGNLLTARLVLKAFGISEKKLRPDYGDLAAASTKFIAGELDALIVLGEVPMPAVVELAGKTPITLLPVSGDKVAQLRIDNDFLSVDIIPAEAYAGGSVTSTVGIGILWLVSSTLDEQLAHDLTKALWNKANRKLLDETGALGRQVKPGAALQAVPVPIHPGAQRYYSELEMKPGSGNPDQAPSTNDQPANP